MIQDIAPHVYDNTFADRRPPEPGDLILLYRDQKVLAIRDEAGMLQLPEMGNLAKAPEAREGRSADAGEACEAAGDNGRYPVGNLEWIFLFRIDGLSYYSLDEEAQVEEAESMLRAEGEAAGRTLSWTPFSELRTAKPGFLAFAAITGAQLSRWRSENIFCGHCGERMRPSGTERAMICPACGETVYPKISPAVIVAVTNGDRILLTKYAGRSYTRYALIAGFAEIGETIEETVHREVMEEVGVRVKNLRYYKSQPWSFSDTLLMGFFCELDGEETITLDREELSVGVWMRREEMPDRRDDISLTSEMMEVFRTGK